MFIFLFFGFSTRAETIFETFDSDPVTRWWTNGEAGASSFSYNSEGYLEAHFVRDDQTARYSMAITPIELDKEFWVSFDCQLVEGETHRNLLGLFGSGRNNSTGSIGDTFTFTDSSENFRHYAVYWDSSGSSSRATAFDSFATTKPYSPNLIVRVNIHNFGDGSFQLDVYDLVADPMAENALFSTTNDSNLIFTVEEGLLFDRFGLGNRDDGSAGTTSPYQNYLFDNLYYSTNCPNCCKALPEFIPEPSSIFMLLGGGFVFLRKRKKLI